MVQFSGGKKIFSKLGEAMFHKSDSKDRAGEGNAIPVLTPEMITPADKPITSRRAVQVYEKFMLDVGFLDKTDLDDFSRSLKEEMIEREKDLKFEIANAKDLVADAKQEVKQLKKQLSKSKDEDDRKDAREELDSAQAELDAETATHELLLQKLAYFKRDKRGFLLNYINTEIHGSDWGKSEFRAEGDK